MGSLYASRSQNLESIVGTIGDTLCRYLAMKSQIHRKFHWQCPQPSCRWDTWKDAALSATSTNTSSINSKSHAASQPNRQRIVLSYSHNGFGNQIWQHTVAFMVAESLNAKLYISIIPDNLCFDGAVPPNTFAGFASMEKLLPRNFLFGSSISFTSQHSLIFLSIESLPASSPDRQLCDREEFVLFDRPRDWRNGTYTSLFKSRFMNLATDPKPRCIKMLGYFQNYPLCRDDVR